MSKRLKRLRKWLKPFKKEYTNWECLVRYYNGEDNIPERYNCKTMNSCFMVSYSFSFDYKTGNATPMNYFNELVPSNGIINRIHTADSWVGGTFEIPINLED